MPEISQCMIVKNEENNIERALSWGKEVVSEQIVVDTGSTDKTVEIAQKMGATVYHFEWRDDFSAAKNYALEQASCEWIAFLDADEYIIPEDGKKLLEYVRKFHNTSYEGLMTGLINLDDKGNGVLSINTQVRVFRNLPDLRYEGRVHEHLAIQGQSVHAADITGEVSIYHTGYRTEEREKKAAAKRNFKLIEAELADHPEDYRMHGYLGNEYEMMKQWRKAKDCYKKAVSLMPDQMLGQYDITASGIYFRLLEVLAFLPETEETELISLYQKAVKNWPEDGDFDYIMGKYYGTHENYEAGEKHIRYALNILANYGTVNKSSLISGKILDAYELLAICCEKNGKLAECVRLTTAVLKEDSYRKSTLVVLLSAFQKDMENNSKGAASAGEVAKFLGNSFYDFYTLKDRLFVLRTAMNIEYRELIEVMKRTFSPEELDAVENALEKKVINSVSLRIVLFYSEVESFNFFTDQLAAELQKRGHEVFIFDLLMPPDENPHSAVYLKQFTAKKIDGVICFDGLGFRGCTDTLIEGWNKHKAVVIDIFMDPPFRYHDILEKHPQKYHVFCCDREHVSYVKKYFKELDSHVSFMPHVGVLPEKKDIIPYKERKYDILFCGTYYRPEDKLSELKGLFKEGDDIYYFYQTVFNNLKQDTSLTMEKAVIKTINQLGQPVSEEMLINMLWLSECVDWAIRMYIRGQVIQVLGKSGLNLYLLGRGWENHPVSAYENVHRIDDRIPYKETLNYMADAKINLNVMPWFKEGTHDRIFNTLLQHSLPLTDSSTWIDDNFTDGVDIALYNLKHLERLPDIARNLLNDSEKAEIMIENGYKKVEKRFTWSNCADWILQEISRQK